MSTKRKYASTSSPPIVYVVLQRSSTYLPAPRDEHDVFCVSVHTSMAAANQAAEDFFGIDEDDGEAVERESGWSDWEDLVGTRVQTDSEGLLRVIMQTDTREENLVWVEKKFVAIEEEEEEEGGDVTESDSGEEDLGGGQENPAKRLKISHPGPIEVIDLTD